MNVLKFLALGRLATGSSGGAIAAQKPTYGPKGELIPTPTPSDKHQVLAYAAATKDEKVKAVSNTRTNRYISLGQTRAHTYKCI